jgi:hypothetical protein
MINGGFTAGDAKWVAELTEQFIAELTMKRIETGYAEIQPRYPYWVKPLNYSAYEWLDMSEWVVDTMGYSDWSVEHARWVGSDQKYWFRDERDRTLFLLKWS